MSGSLENSSFPRKQPVAIFWSNAHAWVYLGFMAKVKSMRKVLVNVFFFFFFFAWKEKKRSPETRNLVIYCPFHVKLRDHFIDRRIGVPQP